MIEHVIERESKTFRPRLCRCFEIVLHSNVNKINLNVKSVKDVRIGLKISIKKKK